MKIYYDGVVYYTQERFISMVRSNAEYIIDPTTTFYSEGIGYSKETVTLDDMSYVVFKPEHLNDEELLCLLTHDYGGFIHHRGKEIAEMFGFETGYSLTQTKEIEVKE